MTTKHLDPIQADLAVLPRADKRDRVTRTELVQRFGRGVGAALFESIDEELRVGDEVIINNVREARGTFSAALAPGHARIVQAGRRPADLDRVDEALVVMALSDLETIVKVADDDFDWSAAFAPRRGLPSATTSLRVASGARGRRVTL
jgi:hypothetical protein